MHPARLPLDRFVEQLAFEVARASGPGGQHRNKVETAVRATHRPTGLRSHASERRSMSDNKKRAIQRLRRKVAMEHREPLDPAAFVPPGVYEPSALWRSRLDGVKIVCSERHHDYSALLSEALDVIEHCDGEIGKAAGVLCCSTSQLIKFLGRDPAALARLNERRRDKGQKPYR